MLRKRSTWSPSRCGLWGNILVIGTLLAATSCESSAAKKSSEFPREETADNQLSSWSGSNVPLSAATSEEARQGKFDEQQAQVVLVRAAKNAAQCTDIAGKDQPRGEATVTVTFAPKGRSTKANINEPFAGTPIGNCVVRAFVDIIIPPFDGAEVDRPQTVDLSGTTQKADAKDAKDAKRKR